MHPPSAADAGARASYREHAIGAQRIIVPESRSVTATDINLAIQAQVEIRETNVRRGEGRGPRVLKHILAKSLRATAPVENPRGTVRLGEDGLALT